MRSVERPDIGYAWVVAICSGIINMLLTGLSRMNSLMFVAVLETYHCSRSEAMLPFSVRGGLRLCAGPLVGIVGQRYGIRTVTFWGGVVASIGGALCFFAPNVTWLTILWGGVLGFGFAFANTLFHVVVNQYFQKHRATASGIALSGACIGSLAFPIMIESILFTYGLAGTFLLLGGVVMHVLPPSLLLKSPPWVTHPEKYAKQLAVQEAREIQSGEILDKGTHVEFSKNKKDDVNLAIGISRQVSLSSNPVEKLVFVNRGGDRSGVISRLRENTNCETKEDSKVVCTAYKITKASTMKIKQIPQIASIKEDTSKNMVKIPTISERVSGERNGKPSIVNKVHSNANENQQTFLESIKSIGMLYTNPVYILISICMSTYVIIFIPIVTVMVDYSRDKGISETYGTYLINVLAIGDLVGRLAFGWVTDLGYMTIPAFMTMMLVFQGIFIALFPLANNLYAFMSALVLYGMASGSQVVLFPLLVLRYVDISNQAVAMACVGFLSGLVSFFIPSLIGHFRDDVGSYDGMFYLTGGISVISGVMWLLEPIVVKCYYGENYEEKVSNKNYFKDIDVDEKNTKPS